MYGPSMSKDPVFVRNLNIKWQTNKNYHLWRSRRAIQSYFWIFGCIFSKVTRVFEIQFEWKQKWLPLFIISMVWFDFQDLLVEVASSVLQVPGTWRQVMWSKWVAGNLFFWLTSPLGANRNFWGGPKFISFGFVVAIIKIWTISLVSLIWDPFQRTCRERPKTAFFSPQKFSWKNVKLWGKGSGKKRKSNQESKLWTPSDFARMEENVLHQTRLYVMLKTWLCATVYKHSFRAKGNENNSAKSAGFSN